MLVKSKKAWRLFFLSFLSAITLISVDLLSLQIAKAGRPENARQLKTDKVSPRLKADRQNADKTVTVIVTLKERQKRPSQRLFATRGRATAP